MAEGTAELKALFEVISAGDKKAFDRLFRDHYVLLKKFALSYLHQGDDTDEVVSEVFVRLWLGRTELSKVSNPKVYLYVSVKNACLNFLRNRTRRSALVQEERDDMQFSVGFQDSPEAVMENRELQVRLDEAVSALPEQRRLIFTMVKQDGLKCREVAEILNISVRTVEGQVFKAVKTLADELTGYLGYNPSAAAAKRKVKVLFFLF